MSTNSPHYLATLLHLLSRHYLPLWASALFEETLEVVVAERGSLCSLAAYQWNQRCAGAVAFEVESEGHTRPGTAVKWFDLDRSVRPDGAVDAAGGKTARRIIAGDLLRLGPLRTGETAGRGERGGAVHAYADHVALPFGEPIAQILDRSVPATKMLASRARRRVRTTKVSDSDLVRRRKVVEALLAASRDGDFQALLNLLDPDVTARADAAAAPHRVPVEVQGADAVARQALAFSSRAAYARVALIDGEPAIVVASGGRVALVLLVTVTTKGKILDIDIVADPYRLARLKPATDQ